MRRRFAAAGLFSDERLARRAVEGDERAFAAIFSRYHQDLYRFCLAIVGNPQDAQDALQNTMVKVLRALPGEQRQIELKPWLYRIAHNESIELLRRRRPTEELDPELLTRGGGLAEDAELRERLRRLLSDLDQLPDRQRAALVMRELAGLEFAEIGSALGTSGAVARQTLYEARLSLRQMDEGREMTCEAVTRALSDADGRVTRRRDIRAHLRACPDCRRFRDEVAARRDELAALSPLPAIAATGLLQGLLGGTAGSAGSGAGLAGAAAGGAAKSLGAATAIKSAAAVAVVAAVGVGAADRGGVVDVTPWGGGSQGAQGERPAGAGAAPAQRESSGSSPARSGDGSAAVDRAASLGAGAAAGADGKGVGTAGTTTAPEAQTPAAPDAPGRATESPSRGRGHEKQHPGAAAHGQQTAAEHKASGEKGSGGGSGKGRSSRPPKSAPPAKQPKPPKPGKAAAEGGGQASAPPKAPANPGAVATPPESPSPPASEPAPPPAQAEAGNGHGGRMTDPGASSP